MVKRGWVTTLAGLLVAGAIPGLAAAQAALPSAQAAGVTTADQPAEYRFTAAGAGFLTVVVRGDGADLVLMLLDRDGQVLVRSDQDVGGDTSAEQIATPVAAAGEYTVVVDTFRDRGTFRIASAFVPFAELATPPDADGAPSTARAVSANEAVEDSINPAGGDAVDWFVFRPAAAGTVTFATRGQGEGDLILEAFADGNFREAAGRSDQDLQDDRANESVTATAPSNEPVYAKVSAFSSSEGAVPYRLVVVFIPD